VSASHVHNVARNPLSIETATLWLPRDQRVAFSARAGRRATFWMWGMAGQPRTRAGMRARGGRG
jgi:hypothetical protein